MKHYVYVYLDPRKKGKFTYDGLSLSFLYKPFYVGKGTGKRCYDHLKTTTENTDNIHKTRVIEKIIKEGYKPYVVKLFFFKKEKDALDLEKTLIDLIGRKNQGGILTNICEGGNMPPAFFDLTPEQQESIRISASNRIQSEETKNKRAESLRGSKRTEEQKQRMSESKKGLKNPMWGKKMSDKQKKQISKSLMNKTGKRVGQFSLKGEFIEEFPSLHEVERKKGYKFSVISRVCRGKRKTAYGFLWKYLA